MMKHHLVVLLPAVVLASAVVEINVADTAVRHLRLDDRFVGATLDWWPASKTSPNPGATHPWADASVLHVNLTKLEPAARALAPFILRIGGSLADQVRYERSCAGRTFVANASAYNGFGYSRGCVEYDRVVEVLRWCESVGFEQTAPQVFNRIVTMGG